MPSTLLTTLMLLGAPAALHDGLHARIAGLDRRIAEAPEDPGLRLLRADLHRRHGEPEAALVDIETARSLRPEWAEVDLAHARLCVDLEWARGARVLVERALSAEPDHPRALLLSAELESERGDPAVACAVYQRLEAAAPRLEPDHYLAWSRAARTAGDVRLARAVLERGVARLGCVPALARGLDGGER